MLVGYICHCLRIRREQDTATSLVMKDCRRSMSRLVARAEVNPHCSGGGLSVLGRTHLVLTVRHILFPPSRLTAESFFLPFEASEAMLTGSLDHQ
jgi:hypothetical protein